SMPHLVPHRSFCSYRAGHHRDLPSFPTRRSSDLVTIAAPALAGGWEAKSTHGVIRLRLPEGADAKIRAKYRFGGLKSDFPLQMEQHDAEGTLGAGTYPVTAETNGNIAIERYRPGAPASMEEDEPDGPGFHVSTHLKMLPKEKGSLT